MASEKPRSLRRKAPQRLEARTPNRAAAPNNPKQHPARQLFEVSNLSVARLFEGHVNAIKLISLYGAPAMQARVAHAENHVFHSRAVRNGTKFSTCAARICECP